MSELATLARPYAAAVFKAAKDTESTVKWSESLAFMTAVLGDKNISVIIDNPKISNDRLLSLMLDICQGQLDPEGENFLRLLVQNNRLSLIPYIQKIFEEYKAADEGYVEVDVFTAFAFSEEENLKFASALEKKLGKKIHMNVTVDKSLIGGVLARAGDRVIDGSIRGRLQHMQKALQ
jgi:F-type H+-transporting ATPase subunit delta